MPKMRLLAKQLKDLGVQTPILTGDGAQVPELLSIGGEAVNGMYFTAHFHRQGTNTETGQESSCRPTKPRITSHWMPLPPWAAKLISCWRTAMTRAGSI